MAKLSVADGKVIDIKLKKMKCYKCLGCFEWKVATNIVGILSVVRKSGLIPGVCVFLFIFM